MANFAGTPCEKHAFPSIFGHHFCENEGRFSRCVGVAVDWGLAPRRAVGGCDTALVGPISLTPGPARVPLRSRFAHARPLSPSKGDLDDWSLPMKGDFYI